MNMQAAITACFSKYATFTGRASRSEYWWFYLFNTVLGYLIQIANSVYVLAHPDVAHLENMYFFMLIPLWIPSLAAAVRRLHDVGKSGWNMLWCFTIIGAIPVVIWLAKMGSAEENQYGPPIVLAPAQ